MTALTYEKSLWFQWLLGLILAPAGLLKKGAKLIYVLNFPQFGKTYLEAALMLASIELIVSMGRLTSAKADATNKLPTRNRNIFWILRNDLRWWVLVYDWKGRCFFLGKITFWKSLRQEIGRRVVCPFKIADAASNQSSVKEDLQVGQHKNRWNCQNCKTTCFDHQNSGKLVLNVFLWQRKWRDLILWRIVRHFVCMKYNTIIVWNKYCIW